MSKIHQIIKHSKNRLRITPQEAVRNHLSPHQEKIREIAKTLATINPGAGDEMVSTYFQDYMNIGKHVIVAHLTHVDGSPVSEDYKFSPDGASK